MDPALRRLILLRLRGGIRHRIRQLVQPGGAISFVILIAVVWLLVTSDWYGPGNNVGSQGDLLRLRESLAEFMPLALLAATVFTVLLSTGSPVHYSAEEINFLLAGPFSRRGILTYKFSVYAFGALVNAAIIALLVPSRGGLALATFAGAAASLLFIQLASTAFVLSLSAVKTRFAFRRWTIAAAVAVVLACAVTWVAAESVGGLMDALREIRDHWIVGLALAPFSVFVNIFLARELWPDLLLWLSVGAAINALLVHAIFFLDRYSGEPSPSRRSMFGLWPGRRRYAVRHKSAARWTRRMPVVYGIGPIVWRQMINAYRGSDNVILVWIVIAAIAGPSIGLAASRDEAGLWFAVGFFIATYVLPKTLILDFRTDVGAMEVYKALPLTAWQIFAGQVTVVAMVASIIEWTLIVGIWLTVDNVAAWWFGVAAVFVLVFNLVFFALENLVFLLFPSRPVPVGRVDFEFMGRTVAEYFGKATVMIAAVFTSGAIGLKVLTALDHGVVLSLLAAWLVLLSFCLVLVGMGGLAFRRFNVSEAMI